MTLLLCLLQGDGDIMDCEYMPTNLIRLNSEETPKHYTKIASTVAHMDGCCLYLSHPSQNANPFHKGYVEKKNDA